MSGSKGKMNRNKKIAASPAVNESEIIVKGIESPSLPPSIISASETKAPEDPISIQAVNASSKPDTSGEVEEIDETTVSGHITVHPSAIPHSASSESLIPEAAHASSAKLESLKPAKLSMLTFVESFLAVILALSIVQSIKEKSIEFYLTYFTSMPKVDIASSPIALPVAEFSTSSENVVLAEVTEVEKHSILDSAKSYMDALWAVFVKHLDVLVLSIRGHPLYLAVFEHLQSAKALLNERVEKFYDGLKGHPAVVDLLQRSTKLFDFIKSRSLFSAACVYTSKIYGLILGFSIVGVYNYVSAVCSMKFIAQLCSESSKKNSEVQASILVYFNSFTLKLKELDVRGKVKEYSVISTQLHANAIAAVKSLRELPIIATLNEQAQKFIESIKTHKLVVCFIDRAITLHKSFIDFPIIKSLLPIIQNLLTAIRESPVFIRLAAISKDLSTQVPAATYDASLKLLSVAKECYSIISDKVFKLKAAVYARKEKFSVDSHECLEKSRTFCLNTTSRLNTFMTEKFSLVSQTYDSHKKQFDSFLVDTVQKARSMNLMECFSYFSAVTTGYISLAADKVSVTFFNTLEQIIIFIKSFIGQVWSLFMIPMSKGKAFVTSVHSSLLYGIVLLLSKTPGGLTVLKALNGYVLKHD